MFSLLYLSSNLQYPCHLYMLRFVHSLSMVPFVSIDVCLITFSKARLKRTHANPSHYLRPQCVWNEVERLFCILTLHLTSLIVVLVKFTSVSRMCNSSMALCNLFHRTLSCAALKSKKVWQALIPYALVFSKICLGECIWSVTDFPAQKPH